MKIFGSVIIGLLAMTGCCVGQDNLDSCVRLAQPLLSENHLVVPSSRAELQMVCDKWRVFVDCINKYVKSRYSSTQKSAFNGAVETAVKNVYKMCNDDSYSQEYLTHAPCIKKMTMDEDRCGRYYVNMARAVTEGLGSDQEICCLHRKFRDCMSSQRGCEDSPPGRTSVRDFVETFLDNGLHVFAQKCRDYVFSSSDCPGANRQNRLDDAGRRRPDPYGPSSRPGYGNNGGEELRPEHRGGSRPTRRPEAGGDDGRRGSTTPYKGWFRPETTTSVWLASNSLDDLAQARRQEADGGTAELRGTALTLLTAGLLAALQLR